MAEKTVSTDKSETVVSPQSGSGAVGTKTSSGDCGFLRRRVTVSYFKPKEESTGKDAKPVPPAQSGEIGNERHFYSVESLKEKDLDMRGFPKR